MNNFRFVLRTLNIIFKYLYVLRYFSIEYSIYKIAYFRNFQRVFTNLHNFLVMNSSNQRFKHFFFFCFIICFSGVRKNRWISSDCEHWKSLIKKIAPKFVWTWSHAYSAWVIWTPVSHAQYIFQWFGKKPRSTDFSKRLTSATSIISVL